MKREVERENVDPNVSGQNPTYPRGNPKPLARIRQTSDTQKSTEEFTCLPQSSGEGRDNIN